MYKGRPIIALMPLYDEKKDSYWMLPGYMKALERSEERRVGKECRL